MLLKKILKIVIPVIVVGILVFTIIQIVFPIKAEIDHIECVTWDATYDTLVAYAEQVESGNYDPNTLFIHSYDGIKSENHSDYMNVYVYINVKNLSLFSNYTVDAAISEIEGYETNVLFSHTASEMFSNNIEALSNQGILVRMDIFVGDLSEDEIRQLVKATKIKIVANRGMFGNYEKEISLSGCDNITIENILSN